MTPQELARTETTPSFRHQTPWETGVFNFGKQHKPGVDFFNCGVARIGLDMWLVTRRSKQDKKVKVGQNDIVAFQLVNMTPVRMVQLEMGTRFHKEHFEDPRVMVCNGRVFVSAANFLWHGKTWTGSHQMISEFTQDWKFKKRFDPVYAKNGPNVGQNHGNEKNWLWFGDFQNPFMLYQASNPHTVGCFDDKFYPLRSYLKYWDSDEWKFGEIRGGTPPVLVDGEYWTFFHSSTQWSDRQRRYHMGAYVFEAKPPFSIKRITHKPLLSGSCKDPWHFGKPPVVFPCGCLFENDNFLVTMGINDLVSGWIRIPRESLEQKMTRVKV